MHAKSTARQKAAGAALSAKRGNTGIADPKRASKSMYGSMHEAQLEEMASTNRTDKPQRVGKGD